MKLSPHAGQANSRVELASPAAAVERSLEHVCAGLCATCVPNLVELVLPDLSWTTTKTNVNTRQREFLSLRAINKGREICVDGEPGIGPGLAALPVRSAGSRLICSILTNVWQILSASSAANESQLPPSKQKRSLVARAKSLTRASACVSSHLLLFMIIICCCCCCCFFQFYTIYTFTHALLSDLLLFQTG